MPTPYEQFASTHDMNNAGAVVQASAAGIVAPPATSSATSAGPSSEVGVLTNTGAQKDIATGINKLDGIIGTKSPYQTSLPTDQPTFGYDKTTGQKIEIPRGSNVSQYGNLTDKAPVTPDPSTQATFMDENGAEYINPSYELATSKGLTFSGGKAPDWYNTDPQARALQKSLADNVATYQGYITQLDQFKSESDSTTAAVISDIQSKFAGLRTAAEDMNKRRTGELSTSGIRSGSAEYTASFGGIVAEEQRQGLQRIADLYSQEKEAINAAKQAQQAQNWKIFSTKMDVLDKIQTSKQKELEDYNKKLTDQLKEINNKAAAEKLATAKVEADKLKVETDKQAAFTNDKNNVLVEAKKNNAPQSVIDAMNSATDTAGILNAAGDYLKTYQSGIVGEYQYYKDQAVKAGQKPLDFNAYQTMDANRKAKIAAAANAAGLTAAMTNTALKLSDDYEQRSKDFYSVRDAYNRVNSAASEPSAAGDLALIFNYMKVLDPGSTVREGEFATAQNSGGAWDRVGAMYNKVKDGERLTESQRKDFVARTEKLFTGAKKQQEATVKEFTDRAKKYGVPADLVVRGTDASSNVGQDLIKSEDEAKTSTLEWLKTNAGDKPEAATAVKSLKAAGHTYIEISEYLKAKGLIK